MRGIGVALISFIPLAVGLMQYNFINQRYKTVCEFEQLILVIKEQMRFSLKEIDALLNFAQNQPQFSKPIKDIILAVKGKNNHEEIINGLQSITSAKIGKNEYVLMADFFAGLGQSDIKGQVEHCEYYREQFERLCDKLYREQGEKSRLWLGLSISLSLAVFVLII